jgi:hypothetical protein
MNALPVSLYPKDKQPSLRQVMMPRDITIRARS